MTVRNGRRRPSPRRPLDHKFGRLCAVAVLCLVVFTGCQTTATVRIAMQQDGSGTISVDVVLDKEAAAQVGDLSRILAVDDLKKAGWTIVGPSSARAVAKKLGDEKSVADSAGTVRLHLSRPFDDVDEANRILASLSGPDGPFREVELSRSESTFKTRLGLTGTVDLSKGLDTFGDQALEQTLGKRLSQTVADSGGTVPRGDDLVIGLQIVPADGLDWQGEPGNDSKFGGVVGVSTDLGGTPHSIDVQAEHTRWGMVIGVGGLVVLVLAGLVAFAARYRRRPSRIR